MKTKQYIVTKLVIAKSAKEALELEKDVEVEDVVVNHDYEPANNKVGFAIE